MKLTALVLSIAIGSTVACPTKRATRDPFAEIIAREAHSAGVVTAIEARDPISEVSVTEVLSKRADPNDYVGAFNAYRSHCGIRTVVYSAQLEANARKTYNDKQCTIAHELNPGTMAQVIAGASTSNSFTDVFIGAWLCERPTACGLDGRCSSPPYNAWGNHGGQTGHYDIVTSNSYSKVGCAACQIGSTVNWYCDLA